MVKSLFSSDQSVLFCSVENRVNTCKHLLSFLCSSQMFTHKTDNYEVAAPLSQASKYAPSSTNTSQRPSDTYSLGLNTFHYIVVISQS